MEIMKKITELLKNLSGKEEIAPSDTLKEDLALDSLSMVMLLVDIEDAFGIELDESDLNPLDLITVEDAAALVRRYHIEEDSKDEEKS